MIEIDSKHYKFEVERNKKGRRTWFYSEDDDYRLLRKHMYDFSSINICDHIRKNPRAKVLEVGPASAVYPDYCYGEDCSSSVIQRLCKKLNVNYKTMDISEQSNCNYICSIENVSSIKEKFDIIIMLGVIEHVPKIHLISEQLCSITNPSAVIFINTPFMFKIHGPNPDCWRISEFGLEALFGEKFKLEMETFPPEERGKNSVPLSINTTMVKR